MGSKGNTSYWATARERFLPQQRHLTGLGRFLPQQRHFLAHKTAPCGLFALTGLGRFLQGTRFRSLVEAGARTVQEWCDLLASVKAESGVRADLEPEVGHDLAARGADLA
jgi:hypothetical protein